VKLVGNEPTYANGRGRESGSDSDSVTSGGGGGGGGGGAAAAGHEYEYKYIPSRSGTQSLQRHQLHPRTSTDAREWQGAKSGQGATGVSSSEARRMPVWIRHVQYHAPGTTKVKDNNNAGANGQGKGHGNAARAAARRAQARQCGVGNKERCEAGVHRFIMGRHMHAAMDSLHFGTGVPVQLQQQTDSGAGAGDLGSAAQAQQADWARRKGWAFCEGTAKPQDAENTCRWR
jgi:hypothetical protein